MVMLLVMFKHRGLMGFPGGLMVLYEEYSFLYTDEKIPESPHSERKWST